MSSKTIYYVYAYLRSKDSEIAKAGTPYYIGKGKHKRITCKQHTVHPPVDHTHIVFVETQLTEVGALSIERRLIEWYGSIDLGTGILRNKTSGGDGASNRVITPSTRYKLSVANKGKTVSSDTRSRISNATKGKTLGIKKSELHRQKMSAAQKGKKFTSEHCANIKKNHHNCSGSNNSSAKTWKITSPIGKEYFVIGQLRQFCKEHNISFSTLRKIAYGITPTKRSVCYNWQCEVN